VARTLAYMNPVARIAVDRHTLLSDIALHNRLLGSGRPAGRPYKQFFVILLLRWPCAERTLRKPSGRGAM